MDITSFEKKGRRQVFRPVFSSIAEFLEHNAKKFGRKNAIISVDVDSGEERIISYADLLELAEKTASFLIEKGVQKGDRIAFAFENTATILVLELAAGLLGASSVPMDVKRDISERKEFKLQDSNAKVFFEDEGDLLREIQDFSLRAPYSPPAGGSPHPNPSAQSPVFSSGSIQDEYLLLYTSGTTARPKGVPLSLRALMANAQGIVEWQQLSQDDVFHIVLPLHHINSTTMSLATLLAGGTVLLNSRYAASKFWQIASQYKATVSSIVPTIAHDLLIRKSEYFANPPDGGSLRFRRILIGSAPVLQEETIQFMEMFGVDVVQGYGQTETALRVTGVPVDLPRDMYMRVTKKNSIGKELAYCNVTILTENGKEAAEKEEGEICVRGPVMGEGYWNNGQETQKVFLKDWFHTGDIGHYEYINKEKYFFIKGRSREIIIKGGINISPAAVEDALLKNFPEIHEVCVVGYEDSRMGEEVGAVITLQHPLENPPAGGRLAEKIVRFGGEGKLMGLSRYEVPAKVFVTNKELPKTSTGKIQRVRVKEQVAEWAAAEKNQHVYCRVIGPYETAILKKAGEIHNKRWQVKLQPQEFEQRAKNGYVIGVFDEEENILGTVSALQITKNDLTAAKTWSEATANGTLENNNPRGDIMLCVSITVDTHAKPLEGKAEVSQGTADAVIADYAKTKLDNVLRFHAKPKGGMKKGAKIVRVLPQGRPEDAEAMGYNVLLEYPILDKRKKIVKSKNALPSFLLMEQTMQLAKEKGCKRVAAFSRPAQFRLHLAKALDPSIDFEPRNEQAFFKFAKLVRKIDGKKKK